MRALLDTNILIHREAATVRHENVGTFFQWLERLGIEKWIHRASLEEIEKHEDERVRRSFQIKLKSYQVIHHPAPLADAVVELGNRLDRTPNDRNDTRIVNELYCNTVDFLISEDRGVALKAEKLGIGDRAFTLDAFLEKVTSENPSLVDYGVLSVRQQEFGSIDITSPFFDSFRDDYLGFDKWFNRKREETAYVCYESDEIKAFLYLKVEDEREPYTNIYPPLQPMRRLKIGTMKVELNGFKIGERFLKIAFDNAMRQRVHEIYVTIYPKRLEQHRLIHLLKDFGFAEHGIKANGKDEEMVLVRGMTPSFNSDDPKLTYPFASRSTQAYLVPIYPKYHTDLLPDSILRTESNTAFEDNEPHRNAIRKVYVSRSYNRKVQPGDLIVFYRTGSNPGRAVYESVVSTIGVVDKVHLDIHDEDHFIRLCRKRSVFSDSELREHWNYKPRSRPFVIEFLYVYTLKPRPNLAKLIEHGVIRNVYSAPRGFEPITPEQLSTILSLSKTPAGIVID